MEALVNPSLQTTIKMLFKESSMKTAKSEFT